MGETPASNERTSLLWYIFPIAVLVLLVGGYLITIKPNITGQVTEELKPASGEVMYFYSEQCHYCQLQKPIVEQLESEGYKIKWMDVGLHPEYWENYSVRRTPTFLAANGDRIAGLKQIDELRTWLDQHGAKTL